MEESKALHKLSEVTDLITLVEEMLNPSTSERLSPAAWSGVRLTLRNIRESVQASHSTLSADLLNRSRANLNAASAAPTGPTYRAPEVTQSTQNVAPVGAQNLTDAQRIQITRRDLKASLEKVIERP